MIDPVGFMRSLNTHEGKESGPSACYAGSLSNGAILGQLSKKKKRGCPTCESMFNAGCSVITDSLPVVSRSILRPERKVRTKNDYVEITNELITEGMSDNGGWGRFQVSLLGLDWPLESEWKKACDRKNNSYKNSTTFCRT